MCVWGGGGRDMLCVSEAFEVITWNLKGLLFDKLQLIEQATVVRWASLPRTDFTCWLITSQILHVFGDMVSRMLVSMILVKAMASILCELTIRLSHFNLLHINVLHLDFFFYKDK